MGALSRRGFVTGAAFAAVEATQLLGCESTTGERVTIESRARGEVSRGESFQTALGWSVTLERANLWIGSILYLEGAALARRFSLLPVAHAHPGHYEEGTVLGEMLEPRLVDLLAGEVVLGVGGGVTGQVRSARLSFEHGVATDPLGGGVVAIAGNASRDGTAFDFTADLAPEHLAASDTARAIISGCPVVGGDLRADAVVRLVVSLPTWLDQVDFSLLEPTGGSVALGPGDPPHNALARGIRKAAAYPFSFGTGA
jgi:hypothetical protein